MTETETEIMNALEELYKVCTDTTEFQVIKVNSVKTLGGILKATLALINRKNADLAEKDAEIERVLREKYPYIDDVIAEARAEAIKEFAERVKARCDAPHWCVWLSEIDEVLEEMGVEL